MDGIGSRVHHAQRNPDRAPEPQPRLRDPEQPCGIRQVRFHDLRHTCASLLHEQGADARTIMEILGTAPSA
ncbi:tyrosine-type recombinase/integrase [Streptomyces sp. NPDC048441]|uniref:tyrosine-type recombinase/integrase n=1 Tax=Streptomyces sp. NPDC048441 TaxID=3365552 RepID=UPI0037161336